MSQDPNEPRPYPKRSKPWFANRVMKRAASANRLAHATDCIKSRRAFFDEKHGFISAAIDQAVDDLLLSWERQSDGDFLLSVSDHRVALHAPFERLTTAAKVTVAMRLGPPPGVQPIRKVSPTKWSFTR